MPSHTLEYLILSRTEVSGELTIKESGDKLDVFIAVLPTSDPQRLSVQVSGALDFKTFVVGSEMILVRARGATITPGQYVIVANDTDRMPLMNGQIFYKMPAVRVTNTG